MPLLFMDHHQLNYKDKKLDLEMNLIKKGNIWDFVWKCIFFVDDKSGLIHVVGEITAKIHDHQSDKKIN